VHVMIVAGSTWVLLGSLYAWPVALVVLVVHLLIDSIRNRLQQPFMAAEHGTCDDRALKRAFMVFAGDQILHLASLLLISLLVQQWHPSVMTNHWMSLWGLDYTRGLILISGFAVGIWGIGTVLQFQMAPLAREVPQNMMNGLLRGGKIIGLLERTLVLTFVLVGKPEGVAFVVAAKSVFRIGDLTNQADRLHAEYIMIGTLRSFTYALITAFFMRWLLGRII